MNGLAELKKALCEVLRSPEGKRFYRERLPELRKADGPLKKGSWRDARNLRRWLVNRLKKYGNTKPEAELLAVLKSCKSSKRCCSAACPKCNYAAQGVLAEWLRDFADVGFRFDRCLTFIPLIRIMPDDDLKAATAEGLAKVTKLIAKLDSLFDEANVDTVIGGIDFDYSEFPQGQHKEHFRPHFHGLGFAVDIEAADRAIRQDFSAKGCVSMPVVIEPFDGRDNWCHYMLKIPNTRKKRKKQPNELGNQVWADSAYKVLTVKQHLQQALLLHELGWPRRFYMRGVRLTKDRNGNWRLALTNGLAALPMAAE